MKRTIDTPFETLSTDKKKKHIIDSINIWFDEWLTSHELSQDVKTILFHNTWFRNKLLNDEDDDE